MGRRVDVVLDEYLSRLLLDQSEPRQQYRPRPGGGAAVEIGQAAIRKQEVGTKEKYSHPSWPAA